MTLLKITPIIASICALFLAIIKFVIGFKSGSVAVMSSAIDSLFDFVVSVFNFFVLKKSLKKPDENYNFGLSKLEALAGFCEGLFIVGIGGLIFYESIEKIRFEKAVLALDMALYVMLFAMVVTFFLVLFLNYVAKKENSILIKTDALHYKMDFLTNLATLVVLIIIYFTKYQIIDAIFGMIISLYICFCALKIIKESASFLLDMALPLNDLLIIKQIFDEEGLNYHALKTRQTPRAVYISVHFVFDKYISLYHAHELSNEAEAKLRKAFPQYLLDINVHLDPYDDMD